MSDEQKDDTMQSSPTSNSTNAVVPVTVEVAEFDKRIRNVEKIVELVEGLSERAFEFGTDYLVKKVETEMRHLELDDIQHKRAVRVLIFLVSVLFVFCTIALFQREIDLIKLVLQSSLAIAAGVGLSNLWKGTQRKKPK
jgi:hypothetical protein